VTPPDLSLLTPRLLIRRFQAGDAETLAGYRSDPDVARYQSWTAPLSTGEAARLVRALADGDPTRPGWFQYAVVERSRDVLVGDVGVNRHENGMQAEIGFTLARSWWGRGYATEAVGRVLERLFAEDGLHRVSAECDARNEASARLLERVGFRREGRRRAHTWIKGEWTDDLLFGLLADEWRAARAGEGADRSFTA
jgi:aminoglycoside 6'-N-acetyltransferase